MSTRRSWNTTCHVSFTVIVPAAIPFTSMRSPGRPSLSIWDGLRYNQTASITPSLHSLPLSWSQETYVSLFHERTTALSSVLPLDRRQVRRYGRIQKRQNRRSYKPACPTLIHKQDHFRNRSIRVRKTYQTPLRLQDTPSRTLRTLPIHESGRSPSKAKSAPFQQSFDM
jgi:hypothetical protein